MVQLVQSVIAVAGAVVDSSIRASNANDVRPVITIIQDAFRVLVINKGHLVTSVTRITVSVDVETTSREPSVNVVSQAFMVSLIVKSAAAILLACGHCQEDRWEIAVLRIRYVLRSTYTAI